MELVPNVQEDVRLSWQIDAVFQLLGFVQLQLVNKKWLTINDSVYVVMRLEVG